LFALRGIRGRRLRERACAASILGLVAVVVLLGEERVSGLAGAAAAASSTRSLIIRQQTRKMKPSSAHRVRAMLLLMPSQHT
jgi:hypothetical protein